MNHSASKISVLTFLIIAFQYTPALAQTTHNVDLVGVVFDPADITITIGDTVHWVWISGFHNVESGTINNSGAGVHDNNFRSGNPTITAGTTFDLFLDQSFLDTNPMPNNVYPYFCVVHANVNMAGTITVQAVGACTTNADCDDSLFCNGVESCISSVCQAGTAVNCNDNVACTTDTCNEATDSCDNTPDNASCPDDGTFCNGTEACDATLGCVSSGDPCMTSGTCNETSDSCVDCSSNADCNDNVTCTDNACVNGACVFTANNTNCVDDNVFCNGVESCDVTQGCISSGNPCAGTGICNEVTDVCDTCLFNSDCDDADACTDDSCISSDCVHTAISGCGTTDGGTTTTQMCGSIGMITMFFTIMGFVGFRARRRW